MSDKATYQEWADCGSCLNVFFGRGTSEKLRRRKVEQASKQNEE